jgi:hypothetical protein
LFNDISHILKTQAFVFGKRWYHFIVQFVYYLTLKLFSLCFDNIVGFRFTGLISKLKFYLYLFLLELRLTYASLVYNAAYFWWGSCNSIVSFICMFCRSLFVLFRLVVVFSVPLRFTDSVLPFGIFKLFLVVQNTIWLSYFWTGLTFRYFRIFSSWTLLRCSCRIVYLNCPIVSLWSYGFHAFVNIRNLRFQWVKSIALQ